MTTADSNALIAEFDADRASREHYRATDRKVRSAHRGDLSARALSNGFRLAVAAGIVAVVLSAVAVFAF